MPDVNSRLGPKRLFQSFSFKFRIVCERLQGLDFTTVMEPTDAGLDPHRANHYSSSGDKYLTKLLSTLNIQPVDSIVDVGCGKGGAMREMLAHRFHEVHGVELSPVLYRIACRNFRAEISNRVQIFNSDASTFLGYEYYRYVYMYNPFPEAVFRPAIERITAAAHARHLRGLNTDLIYYNPVCQNLIPAKFALSSAMMGAFGNAIHRYTYTHGQYD